MLMHPEIHRALAQAHLNDLLAIREPRSRRPIKLRAASRVQRRGGERSVSHETLR